MPYASDKQRRFMHARHPEIAAQWDAEIHAAKRKKRIAKAKVPKIITRKKAALLGAGAGGSLIAYREVPKFFKPMPMYGQEQQFGKGLSRNQMEQLDAAQTHGRKWRERRIAGPPNRIENMGELARLRLQRHNIGRLISYDTARTRKGLPSEIDVHDLGQQLMAGKAERNVVERALEAQAPVRVGNPEALKLAMEQEELKQDFPELRAERERRKELARLKDIERYKEVGRRGTVGGKGTIAYHQLEAESAAAQRRLNRPPPPDRHDEVRRLLKEQLERNKGIAEERGWVKPPPPTPAAAAPHHAPVPRRLARGRLALLGAGIGGAALSAEGVRRSVQRNKDRSRKLVRKDDWGEQQRYLEDQQRAEAKRRAGARKMGWGLNTLGLTGLLGIGGLRTKGPKHVQLGGMWARQEPKYHTLISTKKFKLSASKGPLAMAGGGAGLMAYGAREKRSASGINRDRARRLNNQLAAEHEQNMKNWVGVPR